MQRVIIPDLWIPLSGLLWSWYRIHCRRSLYFFAWMIRWYLNLAKNLKMFQNCLTMPHTTVPTIWMDTALWVSCFAYLSGIGIKYLIFPFLLVMYNLAPAQTGRRGRPAKHGKRLSVETDFTFSNAATGKSLPMSLPQKKNMVQNDCFSVPFSRKICRFSVHGRKKHHWTRPEVTVWNTFHCCYIRFAEILKQAIMNRKRSGLFATIWCEAAKGLKCWLIWSTSVTMPWRFCPIRTNIFLSTVQKAYRSFVLN